VFDTVLGLPVHALVVHAVVVLMPLCTAGVVACAVSRTWYDRLALVVIGLLTLTVPAAFAAKLSGEQLKARLPDNAAIQRHADFGSVAPWVILACWVVVVAWVVVARSAPDRSRLTRAMGVLAVVAAFGATASVVVTGHLGTTAVWRDVIESTNP
jgi:hypothetical protein